MAIPKKDPTGRSFAFSFSPAGLFALLLFAIIALAWAFIFGLLLGRGHQPEELVPEIAKIMPAPPQPPANINESLRPEDLDFYEQLKKLPPEEAPVAPMVQSQQNNRRPERSFPKNVAMTEQKDSRPALPEKPEEISHYSKPQPEKHAPAKKEQKKKDMEFLYRYQIASLADESSALGLQKRLKAEGIAASTTNIKIKGKNWYRIIVEIRGDEDDVKTTAAKLKKEGFSDMILNEKKLLN